MPMISMKEIKNNISPPLDDILSEQLLKEYSSLEERYILGDWEPATLDGGQFVEATARIVYHIDSSVLNRKKDVDECLKYIENIQVQHHYPDKQSAKHTCKVLRAMYKFRSDRGAVHIDPNYTANHLDAKFMLENANWVMAEIIRLFWKGAKPDASKIIRNIIQYDIPCIKEIDDRVLVQRTDCTVEEEILLILFFKGEDGASRPYLQKSIPVHSTSINTSLRNLLSKYVREITLKKDDNFILTDIGVRKVLFELAEKITLR